MIVECLPMCDTLGSTPHVANDIPSSLFAPQALEDQCDVSKPTCTYQAHREHSLAFPLSPTGASSSNGFLLALLTHRSKGPQAEAAEPGCKVTLTGPLSSGAGTASYSTCARQVGVLILTLMCSVTLGRFISLSIHSTSGHTPDLPTNEGDGQSLEPTCDTARGSQSPWAQCTVHQLSQSMESWLLAVSIS